MSHAAWSVSLCPVCRYGGAENASTGKRKYGKGKYETAHFARMENVCAENASTENASTMQTFSQMKKFGISQVSVVHFQVGWASGLQIVFIGDNLNNQK